MPAGQEWNSSPAPTTGPVPSRRNKFPWDQQQVAHAIHILKWNLHGARRVQAGGLWGTVTSGDFKLQNKENTDEKKGTG